MGTAVSRNTERQQFILPQQLKSAAQTAFICSTKLELVRYCTNEFADSLPNGYIGDQYHTAFPNAARSNTRIQTEAFWCLNHSIDLAKGEVIPKSGHKLLRAQSETITVPPVLVMV